MTPEKFRDLYEGLGYTQPALGDLFKRTDRTVRNWITSGPPAEVALLLLLLKSGDITERHIRRAQQ